MRQHHYQSLLITGLMSTLALNSLALAKPPNGWDPAVLGVKLKDADPKIRAESLAKIHEWFKVDAIDGAKELRGVWGQPLLAARQYSELIDLTLQSILAVPGDTPVVEDLLQLRVTAFLANGQPQEALQAAKSFFNVARPQKTPAAILVLAQCLEKDHPEDADIYVKFKAQQQAGADLATQNIRCPLLDVVHIDPTAYLSLLNEYEKKDLSDNRDIVALGNLLLITDDAAKAEETFALLDPANEKLFAESKARTLKAADGTIARANRYLLGREEP
jgi:hypothetical protein